MVLINGTKYACERCIRGHRVTTCTHTDQPLMMIKPKGRPSTTCDLCKELRKNKRIVDKLLKEGKKCTCGRLERRLQQQKLKDEAKLRAKELKKKNKLLNGQSSSSKINLSKHYDELVSERRLSEISLNSINSNAHLRNKSISMLNNSALNQNNSILSSNSSIHSYSDLSSVNSPASVDGTNSFSNGFMNTAQNTNNFITTNSNLFTNKNYSESGSNLFNNLNSNNYLDSNLNNYTSPHSNNVTSPMSTSGKITKDYHRVNSLASISSLHSQNYLEQSFSSPQSPSFYNITNSLPTVGNNAIKDISIDDIMPNNMNDISPDWLSSLNDNKLNKNNDKNFKNNETNINDDMHPEDNKNGLLDTIMNSSALQGMSRASYLLQHDNKASKTTTTDNTNIENNNNIQHYDFISSNNWKDNNTNNAQTNKNNNVRTKENAGGMEAISLTPGFLDINSTNDYVNSSAFLNDANVKTDYNTASFSNLQNLKKTEINSLENSEFSKSVDGMYSNYNNLFNGIDNSLANSNTISNNNGTSSINAKDNNNNYQFGNSALLKDKMFLNDTINTDLDQLLMQNIVKTESDDILNI